MATERYSIPQLAASQAQKHVTVNEALQVIDAAINLVVIRRDLTDPPATPAEGDKYIPASPAGGVWSGRENSIAAFIGGYWTVFAPEVGWRAFDQSTGELLVWDGVVWRDYLASARPARLGVNTSADDVNRLAVKSDAALFSHDDVTPGSGDIRAVMNKATAGNTASLLFQDGFSGRAEVGIVGSDALQLRASADGASWLDALEIDPAAHSFKVTLNGSERGRWTATGLGIGTVSPYGRIHVRGGVSGVSAVQGTAQTLVLEDSVSAGMSVIVADGVGSTARINFGHQNDNDAGRIVYDMGTDSLAYFTNGAERGRFSGAGDFGIGTTTPSGRLHVQGFVLNSPLFTSAWLDLANTVGHAAGMITLNANGGSGLAGIGLMSPDANNGNLTFSTRGGGVWSERLRVTSAGLIGLNTASPTAMLDINSDTQRLRNARTPASASAAGNQGDICWDANYIYVCTATNAWKRAALSTW